MSGTVVITLDEITNSHDALLTTEATNKTTLNSMDFTVFRANLTGWAAAGYPDSYICYSFPILTSPLDMATGKYSCSDGTPRGIWEYIPFCLGTSIQDLVDSYQTQLYGMTLSFSLRGASYILNFHVSKA
jgi:hypothetical protein